MATMNLEIRNLILRLGNFSLEIPDLSISGSTIAISGPNGSGKSTLLRIIDGLLAAPAGTVKVNGTEISEIMPAKRARLLSYLPQEIPSPFAFRAIDVVKLSGYSRDEDEDAAIECMHLLEIDGLANRNFNNLSGGEKRLTMLAGLIYQDSEVILMDEPETYLDIKHKVILRKAMKELVKKGKSVITVIHDLDELSSSAEQTVLMRDGRVLHYGLTGEVINEKNLGETFSVKFLKGVKTDEKRFVAMEDS